MRGVIIDANLLLVYMVGKAHKEWLGKKSRLKDFMPEDYDLLVSLMSAFDKIIVTPNVVTECSDLIGDSEHYDKVKMALKTLVENGGMAEERYVPSQRAVGMSQYMFLGVADCSVLDLVDESTVLLTTDSKLAIEAGKINSKCMNFNHLRNYL